MNRNIQQRVDAMSQVTSKVFKLMAECSDVCPERADYHLTLVDQTVKGMFAVVNDLLVPKDAPKPKRKRRSDSGKPRAISATVGKPTAVPSATPFQDHGDS
jgi:hypothetical protein